MTVGVSGGVFLVWRADGALKIFLRALLRKASILLSALVSGADSMPKVRARTMQALSVFVFHLVDTLLRDQSCESLLGIAVAFETLFPISLFMDPSSDGVTPG